jgi:hypothetical protein
MGKDLILLVRPMAQHREHKVIGPQKPVEPTRYYLLHTYLLIIIFLKR